MAMGGAIRLDDGIGCTEQGMGGIGGVGRIQRCIALDSHGLGSARAR